MNESEQVLITNQTSSYYGQVGTLVEEGVRGGWYILFADGKTVYIPYGWQKMNEQTTQPEPLTCGPITFSQRGPFLRLVWRPGYDHQLGHVLSMEELEQLHKLTGAILESAKEGKDHG